MANMGYGGPYDSKRGYGQSQGGYPLEICRACGVTVVGISEIILHNEFHDRYILREVATAMGSAAWCDNGNHAFKAGTPGSQSGEFNQTDDDGRTVSVRFDSCPDHAFQPNGPRPTVPEISQKPGDLQ